jgi:hypothetical protein
MLVVQVFASAKKLATAPHPDDADPHANTLKGGPSVGAAVATPNSSGHFDSSFMGVMLAALAVLVAVLL